MKWNIVCDSACDILTLKHMREDTMFSIAPIKIRLGDKEYSDDENLDVEGLIADMRVNKGPASSACPAPFEYADLFMKADNTICITITKQLSGCYNSTATAKEMVLEQHPEKKIHIVNSRATSGELILLAMKVNELINRDKTFEEVVNEIEQYNQGLQLTFCLGSYDALIKAGRMSPIVGSVASALKIKAVAIRTVQGEISVVGKVRGENAALNYMVKQMSEVKDLTKAKIIISHCHYEEGAKKMKAMLKEMGAYNVFILPTRGLCSYYTGEGGIIIAY